MHCLSSTHANYKRHHLAFIETYLVVKHIATLPTKMRQHASCVDRVEAGPTFHTTNNDVGDNERTPGSGSRNRKSFTLLYHIEIALMGPGTWKA